MINQRIKVIPVNSNNIFGEHHEKDMIIIYKPKLDHQQNYVYDNHGAVIVERIGGVKSGSTGVITGPSLRAHRSIFIEYNQQAGLPAQALDLVHIYPVQFDQYAGIGWVLADTIKMA